MFLTVFVTEKAFFFDSPHASFRNLTHSSDFLYGKTLDVTEIVRTCSCYAINCALKNHFAFLSIYRSKKIVGPLTLYSQSCGSLFVTCKFPK